MEAPNETKVHKATHLYQQARRAERLLRGISTNTQGKQTTPLPTVEIINIINHYISTML